MNVFSSIVSLLFPTRCVVCGLLHPDPLCMKCVAGLPYISGPVCPRCGAMLGCEGGGSSTALSSDSDGCSSCVAMFGDLAGRRSSAEAGAAAACSDESAEAATEAGPDPASQSPWPCRSLMVFEGTSRDVIHALKYANGRRLAPVLARAAVERIDRAFFHVDVLTFVPLHPARRAERGYNQSLLVARALGRLIDVPVAPLLRQARRTADQAQLSAEERRANVAGAYDCARDSVACCSRRVMLIDDVLTTGATTRECAGVLFRAGATEVRVLTLARAPLD